MEKQPKVTCVMLNWNGWQDTLQCLAGIADVDYGALETIVVDNASSDDSVARIRSAYPHITVIESGSNLGFAGGNNLGIRRAMSEGSHYVWLLNNDTIPAPESLRELVKKAEADMGLGAVGSVLYYPGVPERIQAWGGGQIYSWIPYSTHAFSPKPDAWFEYLTAASMLVRCEALEDAGLLDEEFFLYWEDTELCFRLRRHGWRLGVAAESRLVHRENGSTRKLSRIREVQFTASGIRFFNLTARIPRVSVAAFLALQITKSLLTGKWKKVPFILEGTRYARARMRTLSVSSNGTKSA
ncbi:MAG TPA: glycosyltransferase family 2 protein [Acidobacteriaceae bacterium]|nr:glycosyltransferase family 2 protein [Acidobacteriaceae bacterium]